MNLTRDEARGRAELLDIESYHVTLDLRRPQRTFGSTTVVRFRAKAGTSTFIDAITDTVHEVVLNGRPLDPGEVSDDVRIQLPDLEAVNELRIVSDATYMNTGEGLHKFVDPVDNEVYLYSQFEVPDSRRMFAVFEQPDLKASFTFTVTAPAHWTVVSNSATPRPHPADDGNCIWEFPPTESISSYITALIAGPYDSVTSELTSCDGRTIELGVYARQSLMQYLDAGNIFELTRQGFEFYEHHFGTPYPFAKYDQLFVPEFNAGAMENAGAVTLLENYIFRSKVTDAMVERRAITILHELAHMWFGDLVTMRWWNDLWLNESFAEFMSTLAASENTEWKQAWTTFASLEKSWAYRQDQLPTTHPIVAPINDLEDVQVNFDGITYAKGASVLKQLVAWVGRDEFMEGVRRYFAKHAWRNTELKDLLAELEESSGRDLSLWSAHWLETAGVNTLRPEIETDGGEIITSFTVVQSAPDDYPSIRPHRMAIGFYDLDVAQDGTGTGKLVRNHRLELDISSDRTTVPELVGLECPDLVLLNDDDLAYAKVRLDDSSLETAKHHLKDFADSLPRTLVWGSAWDAARDGETPARRYVDLVLNNIAHESDSSVVLVLLRQLTSALNYYVHPGVRRQTIESAADSLWRLARDAGAGSDSQLQFTKAFASLARTAGQLDRAAGLLDGSVTLDGLDVDTDLRWELLTALVAGARADESAIDHELTRDNTSSGQRAAALARAAIPTPEAKEAVWHSVVVKDDNSNAVQQARIAGFNRVHDTSLLEPFVDKYFDAVPGIVDTRTHELSQQIVVGLFPAQLATRRTLEQTDAFLESLPAGSNSLRRLTLENRDNIARALKAQQRDK
ncbi:aminopeptidase N [Arthrobacter castelli]|uniref:aminopeptidase N n=1 Tax=Arthrobacter castelli TaxID=271431 RepID=UPI00047BCE75|nr:aminopeptidase N [Arthrobacter castelli]